MMELLFTGGRVLTMAGLDRIASGVADHLLNSRIDAMLGCSAPYESPRQNAATCRAVASARSVHGRTMLSPPWIVPITCRQRAD